ncbi:MAG: Ig-like domain-containing protein [Gemmatimonadaceae bacterium]
MTQPANSWSKTALRSSKVVVTACSAGAALVSILSYAQSHGLLSQDVAAARPGGAEPRYAAGAPAPDVAWIGITPAADTATSIGDTLHLTARVADARGGAVVAPIAWSSDSVAVASVSADGAVVAKAPGTVTIFAAAGAKVARARVVVRPRVVGARIVGDSVTRLSVGERRRLREQGLDARGYAVERRAVAWRVADSAVARVDSTGETLGLAPGHTTVSAVIDGISTQTEIEVIDVPASLAIVGGETQHASVGRTLPRPLEVEVLSAKGRPVAGVAVRFGADGDDGRAEPATATTDARGRARARWTLGDAPGRQSLSLSVDGVATPTIAHAESEPVAANVRTYALSEMATGRVSEEVQDETGVRLTDSLGRVLPDVPVTWAARDGGHLVALRDRTDSLGQSRVRWTLGPKAGVQHAVASIGNGRAVPRVTIGAVAVPGPVAALVVAGGGGQSAKVGAALPHALVLRAVDKGGNAVPGLPVTLVPAHGTVADSAPTTDSLGAVRVAWTLGRAAGAQRLLAHVAGVTTPLTVSVRARPLAPANVAFPDSAPDGPPGRTLPSVIAVLVTDAYGNPVPDALVQFRAESGGSVSSARMMTDADGRASTRWRLGTKEGEQRITASVKGSEARATATVRAVVPEPAAARPAPEKTTAPPATKSSAKPAATHTTSSSAKTKASRHHR